MNYIRNVLENCIGISIVAAMFITFLIIFCMIVINIILEPFIPYFDEIIDKIKVSWNFTFSDILLLFSVIISLFLLYISIEEKR